MFRELATARRHMRDRDLVESKNLLWELVTSEPTVLHCFEVIEAMCLAQGVFCKLDGRPCTEDFQRFVDRHYREFCKAAIRACFTYGFVPWRIKTLDSHDRVPEVLPHGTFQWYTEQYHTKKKHEEFMRAPTETGKPRQKDPGLLVYTLKFIVPMDIKEDDVYINNFIQPALDISVNSAFYATVPSPLAHILTDYKNLRSAQIRRSHADAWNTTAKLICSFKPNTKVQEDPTSSLMDFADESLYTPAMNLSIPGMAPLLATNLWSRDVQIRKQFEGVSATHHPDVFTLPRDHDVAQQPMLNPCEDLDFLINKFHRDVCACLGVPEDMVHPQSSGRETVRKTVSSGKIFQATVNNLCVFLQNILLDAYKEIYGKKSDVEFVLLPMPRLEIETVSDLKVLYDIGAITPDMGLQLSSIVMGEELQAKKKHHEMVTAQAKRKAMEAVKPGAVEKDKNKDKGKDVERTEPRERHAKRGEEGQ